MNAESKCPNEYILECTDVRKPVAGPDLQISEGPVTSNPEIRGGGRPVSKNIFLVLQASEFGLKIRGAGSTDPSPGSTTVNSCESDYPKKTSVIISCGVNAAEVKIIVLRNRKIVKRFYRLGLVFLLVFLSFLLPAGLSKGCPEVFQGVLVFRDIKLFI